jgi:Uma2 family endonuclease
VREPESRLFDVSDPAARHHYSYADYLDLEEASNVKHEFFAGEIYAFAGGTPDHAALAVTVATALVTGIGGRDCRVFSSDLRVRVLATGLATYPDATVVCGPLERDPENRFTVVNPTLVAEVLSDGTESYDRGEKLEHYKQIPSLRECLLVSHRQPQVEVWCRRNGDQWERRTAGRGDRVRLESLGCEIAVDDIYRRGLEDSGAR